MNLPQTSDFMITLGIESSCDDTAVAILRGESEILANVILSQNQIHQRFGGIVPELASRQHIECITDIVDEALRTAGIKAEQIDLIAVTQGPGLIGSLLVGFSFAKSLSYILGKPFVGVDHMAGHILSAFLEPEKPAFPYVALIVSGGTTALYNARSFFDFTILGRTRDDAAGEAFDKVARLLKLGYPGGPLISQSAVHGNPDCMVFPRAWLEDGSLDFSFSGLKTAVMNHCNKCQMQDRKINVDDLCASFQEAIVDVLVEKTIQAAIKTETETIVIGGGVSANERLRFALAQRCKEERLKLYLPTLRNCTDNGAMIAFAGYMKFKSGITGSLNDDVFSRSHLGQ